MKLAQDQESAASADENEHENETVLPETSSTPSAHQIPQPEEQAPDENALA